MLICAVYRRLYVEFKCAFAAAFALQVFDRIKSVVEKRRAQFTSSVFAVRASDLTSCDWVPLATMKWSYVNGCF